MRHSLLAAVSALALLAGPVCGMAQDDGGTLRTGQRVTGQTGESGRDYVISLRAGEGIEAVMRSDAIDSVLEIYGPDGSSEPLSSDDDGLGEGLHARLRFVADVAGQYRLRAKSWGDDGQFDLAVESWRPVPLRAANLSLGRRVSDRLTTRSPEQQNGEPHEPYRLNLTQGQRISVRLESEDFDPMLRIGHAPYGTFDELAVNDDGPSMGLNALLNFTAPRTGTYYVHVLSVDGEHGAFTLLAEEAAPLAAPVPVTAGAPVDGELTEKSAIGMGSVRADRYGLSAQSGQAYEISLVASDFDAYLAVYDANGQELATDDDSLGDLNASLVFIPEADGEYIIEARGLSDSAGTYTLSVEGVEPPPAPMALPLDQEIEGTLSDDDARLSGNQRYDAYTFSAVEGQRLQIAMTSSEFDTVLEVGKAGGTFVALESDDDGMGQGTDSRLMFDVPEDGDYVVRALSFGEGRGSYGLRLTDRGPEPKAGSLLVGSTVRGTLGENDNTSSDGPMGSGGYYDDYVFTAGRDDKLRFILVAPQFDAVVMVGQQTGSSVNWTKHDDDGLSDTHSRLIWTAPRDGEYVVRVTSFGPNATGEYSLIVEPQP